MVDYKLTNTRVYLPRVNNFEIKSSTSSDGWKYHKPNKKRKKNRR